MSGVTVTLRHTVMCHTPVQQCRSITSRFNYNQTSHHRCYRQTRAGINRRRSIRTLITTNRSNIKHSCQHGVTKHNLVTIPLQPIPSKQDAVCVLLNARSARKALIVREHLLDQNADFMFITETWLKPSHSATIKELTPPGYTYVGHDRPGRRAGGGVGLLHRSTYEFNKLPTTRFETFEHMEVKSTTTSLKIIIIYHPRASTLRPFLAEISTYLSDITVAREDIIIVGDFNLHLELPNATGVKEFTRCLLRTTLYNTSLSIHTGQVTP